MRQLILSWLAKALLYASEHPEQAINTVKAVAKTFDRPVWTDDDAA